MTRTVSALHTLQNGQVLTAIDGLPGPDDYMGHDDLVQLARQIQSTAIDNQRLSLAPLRHPMTPGFIEYPTFEESAGFEPVGIDSEGGSCD